MMIILLTTFLLLLSAHWVADYPLQGEFLATAKQKGPLRVYHLIAHSGIHSGAVFLVTGSFVLAIIEWIAHSIIDELKVQGKTSFAIDQTLHVLCKLFYVILLGFNIL